ncbi:phage tail protein [Yersinia enterocolitica]|uniref:phage tail protein n=1 Tax=Yersinia enterocolitica TaxID=630 RepID=UPI0005E89510|nr:phage tail protein [Yersinia enterocolitica]EKN3501817.1 phage tail protein [Yersinia enterocolitica]EKN4062465.1 phage tail protein [Yersinia enterocolitica]EKN4177949.1 phage tail protein [Yersinia enterocolitica]CQH25496.1 variable tail fiber protein [Yersinia enterocolitica]HDL7388990.1 phage tail protein [Yersinia enterocolitica]
MTTKYFAILTNQGAARLANAAALGTTLKITHMSVGDGGGKAVTPNPEQTTLINEVRRGTVNMLSIDPQNINQIIVEQVIPENEGGWFIREIGLFDSEGMLIAVANCPETYKPLLQEGSGRTQTIRMILIVSSTNAVELKIDPSVVLATRQYVDNKIIEVKQYADALHQKHIDAANPHSQYAFKHSPDLTGIPTAPTPAQDTNNQQIATTEFVRTWINFLKGDVPVELGSLKALADALDTKLAKDSNGSDIPNKPLFAHNIGVYNKAESDSRYLRAQDNLPVGIPLPWPLATPPTGWIICNGQAFDKAHCPQLALAYPSGVLPDLRGLFIRGWDNGRNLDGGRTLLSFQGDAIRNITGFYIQNLAGNSYWNGCGGAFYQEGNAFGHHANNSGGNGATTKRFDASRVVPTANENRPVNMAFNYIVRAA